MAQLDYPIRPNAKGGFDILLKPTLNAPAVAEAAAIPSAEGEPPPMADTGPEDWMSAVGEAARTRGVNVPAGLNGARAQYTPSPMPPDMGGGPLGKMLPAGMSDTLAGVAGGMNTIDRNQSPLAGFAAGMAGAMTTREGRRKSKREEMLADEERQYQRSRDAFRDKFLLTAEERAQAAEGRAGETFKRDEALDAMSAQIKGLEIKEARINLERLATQQGFTVEQSQKAMDQAARLTEAEYKEVTIDTPELKAEFQASLQRNLQIALQAAGGGGGGATAGGAGGTGTSATDPVQWTPGQSPKTEAEFISQADAAVAANGGKPVYIKNPKTGQVGLYPAAAR